MLSNVSIFAELTPGDLETLSRHVVVRKHPKNVIVIAEGDTSDSLYVINSGKVKIYLNDESGKEVILNIQGEGEHFGELALLDEEPRSASVMTLEPTSLAVIRKSDFQQCVLDNPAMALRLLQTLSRRVRDLSDSVRNLALHDVYQRIAHILQQLAEENDDKFVIRQRLTHQDIANMVGASREMVSKIMKELVIGGYITNEAKQITIEKKLPARW